MPTNRAALGLNPGTPYAKPLLPQPPLQAISGLSVIYKDATVKYTDCKTH